MEKILVIQTAFIGDAILTLPMIEKLKEFNPDSNICVLCIPETEIIFNSSPFVSETIILDKKGNDKSLIRFMKFIFNIKNKKFTRIYSPHRSFRTSLIVKFSGVKNTTGFTNASLNTVYKNLVEYHLKKHEIQRNLDLIGFKYDNENWKIIPKLNLDHNLTKPLEKYFVNYNTKSKLALIAPGSVWETKKYLSEYFEEIIKYLISKDFYVLLIGGKNDRKLCESIAGKFGENVSSAAGDQTLIESVVLIKKSQILICNDSAPTHLGMCADASVLTIYCSTVVDFGFYPYNNKSKIISYDDLSCKPCGIHGHKKCPINTFECAYKLKPEIVISKIEEMI